MVKSKNSLNLKPKENTSKKSVYSHHQVDGIQRKQTVHTSGGKISEAEVKDLKNKSLPSIETTKFTEKKIEKIPEVKAEIINEEVMKDSEEGSSVDDSKRLFFKMAGVAGLGLAASALFPKGADAYVAGSTPTSNVVGLKDSTNTRIDPAKEGGNLATLAGKDFATQTTLSTLAGKDFATQTTLSTLAGKDFATQTTLSGIKSQTDNFTFTSGSLNVTSGAGGTASVVGIKDTTNTTINPAQDETIMYLRRLVKLMESQGTVDQYTRQRVAISEVYGTGASVANQTPRVTVANDSSIILAAGTNVFGALATGTNSIGYLAAGTNAIGGITTLAGQNQQMYQDPARTAFAIGIRNNLLFT
jgi:hypothetical protein